MSNFKFKKTMKIFSPKHLMVMTPLLLAACSQMPVYEKPKVDMPKVWAESLPTSVQKAQMTEEQWWDSLSGDKVLYQLIEKGRAQNKDIQIAVLRLKQERSYLTQAQAGSYPELDATAGASRTKSSDQTYPVGQGAEYNSYSLGGLLSYEVDIWGRVSSMKASAEASLKATEANKDAVDLSVTAAIANAYLNLRALDHSVILAEDTVTSRKEALDLRKKQLQLGSITPLSVQQAEAELASVQVSLYKLREQRDLQRHALSLLLGESPEKILQDSEKPDGKKFKDHQVLSVPMGVPSDLLLRRPDVVAAEQNLIAANANIGVARASLFPSISLTGLLGVQSESLSNLFKDDAFNWNVGASLTAPIFDYGKRRADVEISQAEEKEMLIQYQDTVRKGFAETLDALTQYHASQLQLEAQQRQVTALANSLDLAKKRFDAGYSSYLEVLDAQRSLFNAQLSYVNTKLEHYSSLVSIYKAIGGNWILKS
ncbi:efflux transporter outer membrane subunit [Hydrogenovibrio sp. JE_KL2]|uniref:efflux transporter outer membrane subunit n=1 Tax=Hydrogenovibrio sp. JE_KL2 TaxID=2651188 RepID=UPI00128D4BC8|nr:efflux transporter outer membrane subunit [Hydrogenovibrio sp. JE_KL2]MPQ77565.1 efflux transporter outer membrane subunit [Hydrogenovibrio sp. JE_KL2]